jgi:hypothetical protein
MPVINVGVKTLSLPQGSHGKTLPELLLIFNACTADELCCLPWRVQCPISTFVGGFKNVGDTE